MALQQIMIKEVDDFCGRKLLIKKLEAYSGLASLEQEKIQFNILIVYFDALYETKMDVESVVIKYRENSYVLIDILSKYIEIYQCETLKFIRKMIRRNLEYTEKLRRLG